jgi:putative intracellular protease/amidase
MTLMADSRRRAAGRHIRRKRLSRADQCLESAEAAWRAAAIGYGAVMRYLLLLILFLSADAIAAAEPQRVLMVVTSHDRKGEKPSGFWLSELTHPRQAFIDAGFPVDVASPRGGEAPVDPESLDLADPVNAAFWNDSHQRASVTSSRRIADMDARDYAAIFIAGGHGAMWDLPDDAKLAGLIAAIHGQGGVVGAVCHGPAALINVKLEDGSYLVANREIAAFTNAEEREAGLDGVVPFLLVDRLADRGALIRQAAPFEPKVVISERLVTGQNPASARGVGEAMVALLKAAPARPPTSPAPAPAP